MSKRQDALFSVKYGLYTGKPEYEDHISYVAESGNTYLYENLYTLPLGFMIDSSLEWNWPVSYTHLSGLFGHFLCSFRIYGGI